MDVLNSPYSYPVRPMDKEAPWYDYDVADDLFDQYVDTDLFVVDDHLGPNFSDLPTPFRTVPSSLSKCSEDTAGINSWGTRHSPIDDSNNSSFRVQESTASPFDESSPASIYPKSHGRAAVSAPQISFSLKKECLQEPREAAVVKSLCSRPSSPLSSFPTTFKAFRPSSNFGMSLAKRYGTASATTKCTSLKDIEQPSTMLRSPSTEIKQDVLWSRRLGFAAEKLLLHTNGVDNGLPHSLSTAADHRSLHNQRAFHQAQEDYGTTSGFIQQSRKFTATSEQVTPAPSPCVENGINPYDIQHSFGRPASMYHMIASLPSDEMIELDRYLLSPTEGAFIMEDFKPQLPCRAQPQPQPCWPLSTGDKVITTTSSRLALLHEDLANLPCEPIGSHERHSFVSSPALDAAYHTDGTTTSSEVNCASYSQPGASVSFELHHPPTPPRRCTPSPPPPTSNNSGSSNVISKRNSRARPVSQHVSSSSSPHRNPGSASTLRHSRRKSGSALHSRFTSSHSRQSSMDFVNFTPSDKMRILTGVAPSGSSKTKAKREKEAADKRRRLSQAARQAVLSAGGDVRLLEREGLLVE